MAMSELSQKHVQMQRALLFPNSCPCFSVCHFLHLASILISWFYWECTSTSTSPSNKLISHRTPALLRGGTMVDASFKIALPTIIPHHAWDTLPTFCITTSGSLYLCSRILAQSRVGSLSMRYLSLASRAKFISHKLLMPNPLASFCWQYPFPSYVVHLPLIIIVLSPKESAV